MEVLMPPHRKWSRVEYERLIEQGAFRPDERLELVHGEILAMTPQKGPHMTAVGLVQDALGRFHGDWHLRVQGPLAVAADSEPEPDLAVVLGHRRDYVSGHPRSAKLVVEVADTSLAYDRQVKGPLYAAAGIPEYWIVNVVDRIVEVYREPSEREGRWEYRLVQRFSTEEAVSPLLAASQPIPVADLLP